LEYLGLLDYGLIIGENCSPLKKEENSDQKTAVEKNLFFKHFFTIKKKFSNFFFLFPLDSSKLGLANKRRLEWI
jgi:hypothetical protein